MDADSRKSTDLVWISLWFGSLTSRYLRIIASSGLNCFLITGNIHFDPSVNLFDRVSVIDFKIGRIGRIRNYFKLIQLVKSIGAKTIIADESKRPLLLLVLIAISLKSRLYLAIHDPLPHDEHHVYSSMSRLLLKIVVRRSTGLIGYSRVSCEKIQQLYPGKLTVHIPLICEVPASKVVFEPEHRRDFAMIGRWSPYKGFEAGLDIWNSYLMKYPESNDYLDLWLSGVRDIGELPRNVRIQSLHSFPWNSLNELLPHYKGILLPYFSASQSGVQIAGWLSAVPCLVSNIPGLVQNQPFGDFAIEVNASEMWIDAIHALSDSVFATKTGIAGKAEVDARLTQEKILKMFLRLLE